MPELPEVETVVDGLKQRIIDKKITRAEVREAKLVSGVEPEEFKELVNGTAITAVRRRGKYIIIELDNGYFLVGHLRMTGQFVYTEASPEIGDYDYILFYFGDGSELRLSSRRKFTRLYLVEDLDQAGSLTDLGPEPLSEEFSRDKFKQMLEPRRGMIKPLLLNQKFLAGLGNIYVDEALHRAGIHPERKADSLTEAEINRLHEAIRQVLEEGIKYRGTTKSDYVDADGEAGGYQDELRVYDREGDDCLDCEAPIERIKVSGRSSYYCPACQQEE